MFVTLSKGPIVLGQTLCLEGAFKAPSPLAGEGWVEGRQGEGPCMRGLLKG